MSPEELEYKRGQAIAALANKVKSWGSIPAPASDQELDKLCRAFLGLPARPEQDSPYGWILPQPIVGVGSKGVKLDVPYYSQYQNKIRPESSCLATSVAMIAEYLGVKYLPKDQSTRLPDKITHWFLADTNSRDRFNHYEMSNFMKNQLGIETYFSSHAKWSAVNQHLEKGFPVIIAGKFTSSGHIIVLTGFNRNGYYVHDPGGEFFYSGYDRDVSGSSLHYSYELIFAHTYGGSLTTWAHFPSGKIAPKEKRVKIKVKGAERLSPQFLEKVDQIADFLEVDSLYLLAVMSFETGGTFSPSIRNMSGSGATGLIQFMPATAKGLGTDVEFLAKLSAEEQLTWVEKYFWAYKGRLKTLEDVYMAVLYPSAIGKPAGHVLFTNSIAYRQNAGLDANRDGRVTVGEATLAVRRCLLA